MSYSEVTGLVGEPEFDLRDLKGYGVWYTNVLLVESRMIVYFNSDSKVDRVSIDWFSPK